MRIGLLSRLLLRLDQPLSVRAINMIGIWFQAHESFMHDSEFALQNLALLVRLAYILGFRTQAVHLCMDVTFLSLVCTDVFNSLIDVRKS